MYVNELMGACKEDEMGREQVPWMSAEHMGSRTELPVPHNMVQQPVHRSDHSVEAQEASPWSSTTGVQLSCFCT